MAMFRGETFAEMCPCTSKLRPAQQIRAEVHMRKRVLSDQPQHSLSTVAVRLPPRYLLCTLSLPDLHIPLHSTLLRERTH